MLVLGERGYLGREVESVVSEGATGFLYSDANSD